MSNHQSAESHYDALDQQGMWDAAEMREMSGYTPDHGNEDFTVEAIASRLGPAALGAFKEADAEIVEAHDGSNQKHGPNHQSWGKHFEDPAERERILNNIAQARQAMHGSSQKD